MPVIARLAGERNFRDVYRHGLRLRGRGLGLNYLKVKAKPTRVAVVVSRKVSKLATKRNLYKRRLWASLRAHRQELPSQDYYLVIAVQPAVRDLTYLEFDNELKKLLTKLH